MPTRQNLPARAPPLPPSRGATGKVRAAISSFLANWWSRKGSVVLALVDDILLYACYLAFVTIMHVALDFAATHFGFDEGGLHKAVHKWGFLALDITIVLGLIRKLFVTLVWRDHD